MSEEAQDRRSRVVFKVRGIDCTTCALAIERQVKKMDGVEEVGTALMLNKMIIDYDETKTSVSKIMKTIDKAGYSNYLVSKVTKVEADE